MNALWISFWAILANNLLLGSSIAPRKNHSLHSSKFRHLLSDQANFVDKTLFIESFFKEGGNYRSLSCPKKFGKSSLLNMLKFFVQIEVDDEGKIKNKDQTKSHLVFTSPSSGLQISQFEKIIKTHLAEYPVIHVSFKGIVRATLEKSLIALRRVVRRTFEDYDWLYDLLSEKNPAQCRVQILEQVKNDLLTGSNLTGSLYELSELLFCYFGKRVFVFIDDHDAALEEAFAKEFDFDINQLHDLVVSMTSQLMQPKSQYYVAYAFITSVTQTTTNRDDYPRTIDHYRFLKSDLLAPFCGFTDDEVNSIVDRNGQIDITTRRKMRRFFGGYAVTPLFLGIYNPFAVKEFISRSNHEDISSIRQTSQIDFLPTFFENNLLYKVVLHLCFSKSSSVYSNVQWFNVKKVTALIDNIRKQEPPQDSNVDVFFWYFLENGYFTYCQTPPVHFRIPNEGIRAEIVENLFAFYDSQEDLNQGTEQITEMLQKIFQSQVQAELLEKLQKFLNGYVSKMTRFFHQSTNKEYHYQAVLYYWMKKSFANITIVPHDKDDTSNVISVDENGVHMLIQLKCKCQFKDLLQQVAKHTSSLAGRHPRWIHYLAINYKRNFTQIAYRNLTEGSEIFIDDYTIPKTTSSITWFTKRKKKVSKNKLPWVRYQLGPIDDQITKRDY